MGDFNLEPNNQHLRNFMESICVYNLIKVLLNQHMAAVLILFSQTKI